MKKTIYFISISLLFCSPAIIFANNPDSLHITHFVTNSPDPAHTMIIAAAKISLTGSSNKGCLNKSYIFHSIISDEGAETLDYDNGWVADQFGKGCVKATITYQYTNKDNVLETSTDTFEVNDASGYYISNPYETTVTIQYF
jgi:hypothetical protein